VLGRARFLPLAAVLVAGPGLGQVPTPTPPPSPTPPTGYQPGWTSERSRSS
jgi:hypothetical protein